mgnify:CR=1 FL=1|jgi:hypothetical protein
MADYLSESESESDSDFEVQFEFNMGPLPEGIPDAFVETAPHIVSYVIKAKWQEADADCILPTWGVDLLRAMEADNGVWVYNPVTRVGTRGSLVLGDALATSYIRRADGHPVYFMLRRDHFYILGGIYRGKQPVGLTNISAVMLLALAQNDQERWAVPFFEHLKNQRFDVLVTEFTGPRFACVQMLKLDGDYIMMSLNREQEACSLSIAAAQGYIIYLPTALVDTVRGDWALGLPLRNTSEMPKLATLVKRAMLKRADGVEVGRALLGDKGWDNIPSHTLMLATTTTLSEPTV